MDQETKKCCVCQEWLPLDAFYRLANGKPNARCRPCTSKNARAWMDANPDRVRASKERSQAEVDEAIRKMKEAPCMDCGGVFPPECMDFDHRIPADKVRKVSRIRTMRQLLTEVAKCDLVCANCHRIRTLRRGDHLPRPGRVLDNRVKAS